MFPINCRLKWHICPDLNGGTPYPKLYQSVQMFNHHYPFCSVEIIVMLFAVGKIKIKYVIEMKNMLGYGWENKICYGNYFLKRVERLYLKVKYMVEWLNIFIIY